MTLEAFNAAIGEIPNIAKIESGGEQAEQPTQALTGKGAWAMATRLLRKSKTPPPSARQ
ncbi:MAG: hypothetical protein ACYSUV_21200 [Planctomycetota bacterium]|jgi:hypothetical protein